MTTLLAGTQGAANATDYTWTGQARDGAWSSANNWSPRGVPGTRDTATIGGSSSVSVGSDVTVQNLRLGADAEIQNGARLTVTGWTSSDGIVSGLGSMAIPSGAAATFNLGSGGNGGTRWGQRQRNRRWCGWSADVNFGKIDNKGKLRVNVDASVTVAFKDILNQGGDAVLSVTGGTTLVRLPNGKRVQRRSALCQTVPIVLKSLKNYSGTLTLKGEGSTGRAFAGESVENKSLLTCDGALAYFRNDYLNQSGATLVLSNGTSIISTGGAKKFQNSGLVRQTDGDCELRSSFNNNGSVQIQGGKLRIAPPDGNIALQNGGSTTVDGTLEIVDSTTDASKRGLQLQGGILNGNGTIIGDVRNDGGRVQVGHSPGSITINGNFTQSGNGILDMEIWGTQPGTQYDQLRVEGDAYLAGTMNLILGNNFVPSSGNAFLHMTYIERVGTFSKINVVNPVAGRTYRTTYDTSGLMSTTVLTTTGSSSTTTTTTDSAPVVTVSSPAQGASLKTLTSLSGSASGGSAALSSVKVQLYRAANDRVGAAYWAGGTSWTTSAASPSATISGSGWSLPISNLSPALYMLRVTATNAKGASTTSQVVNFSINTGASSISLSNASADAVSDSARLSFTGTLDSKIAGDPARYSVKVNGTTVAVQSVSVSGGVVTLKLASNFSYGNSVVVNWTGLWSSTGALVTNGSVTRSAGNSL